MYLVGFRYYNALNIPLWFVVDLLHVAGIVHFMDSAHCINELLFHVIGIFQ